MDPEATARLIVQAIEDNDLDAQREAAADLKDWYNREGYVPKTVWEMLPRDVLDTIFFDRKHDHRVSR